MYGSRKNGSEFAGKDNDRAASEASLSACLQSNQQQERRKVKDSACKPNEPAYGWVGQLEKRGGELA